MKDELFEVEDFNDPPTPEEAGTTDDTAEEKTVWWKELLSWILYLGTAVLVTLLLKSFVIINATVPTGSMENTIMPGDDLFGLRIAYLFSEPERGDIVIFKYPDDESQKFIKRIIGLPGDEVVIEDGKIYINGSEEPLEEPYLKDEWVRNTGPYDFVVPDGCYFVMGDNRNDSWDARYWDNTYVTEDELIGKAEFIYYPFNRIQRLNKD
jgi:signal peptidase I